ncbi:pilus assembly protein TadG-related protein [Alloalcanivorax xenomutans]|uniref:Pilus assembly protein TadG-related protein n=1 Tax=Alloalcanivorax xenomutans TaxID=1094342 RepID=A0A9Q3W7Y8_9GAMM|nr:pilus assembly protein TadG-related protein [Alloalcanivorax xenomutans]MCE7510640.1 pilus assembly protein TadG-related protein [Alloalcanivorax xenomutans]
MKRQRGALTVVTPLIIILIVLFSALALDGARLYSVRSQMQSIANVAATAAADAAQACYGGAVSSASIEAVAKAVADEHGMDELSGVLVVQPGVVERGADNTLGFRQVDNLVSESNAVRVEYSLPDTPISRLIPGLLGDVDLKRVAVAKKEVIATVSAAGSTAVVGGPGGNAGLLGTVLGGLLGVSDFTLDATSVESLAGTTFALGGFLESIGVASGLKAVDDLVGTDDILQGILAGLDPASDAAGVIQDLLADAGLVKTDVRLDEVIKLITDVQYPDETPVPVYDTVVALALNLVGGITDVPIDGSIDVLGFLVTDIQLVVDTPPTVVVGPARTYPNGDPMVSFHAADISLALKVDADIGLAEVNIPIVVETGGGSGFLEFANCASGGTNTVEFVINANSKVASISTGVPAASGGVDVQPIQVDLLPDLLTILMQDSIAINVKIDGLLVGKSESKMLYLDYDLYEKQTDSESLGGEYGVSISEGGAVEIGVGLKIKEKECKPWEIFCFVGDVLGDILDGVSEITNTVLEGILKAGILDALNGILNAVLAPLLQGLGLSLGGMTVSVTSADQGAVTLLDCGTGACDLIQ